MILRPSQLATDHFHSQICIIGSGAAGITLALEVARHKLDVLLVAGGGYQESAVDRRLHQGTVSPAGSHEPLEENRHRALGGATRLWGGRLVPFDAIDFETRPHVPMSGWPIDYKEVAERFGPATALCETTPDEFRQPPGQEEPDLPATLGNEAIETTFCERWSMPTDFGARYRSTLNGMQNVRVLMDYHAIEVRLSSELDRVTSVKLVSRCGRPLHITADVFVLATGSIENARLLLSSRSQVAGGVGNQGDMVGRCYMSHVAGTYGYISLRTKRKPPFYLMARDRHGAYRRRRFRLSDRTQRERQVMSVIGFPLRPRIADPAHRDAVLSMLYFEECLSRRHAVERPGLALLGRHIANCVLANPAAWLSAARQLWLRSRRPRLPFILPHKSRAQDALFFQGEHAPNPESRLVLSDQRDEFGLPRIQAQIRFSEVDYRTVIEFYQALDQGLQAAHLGRLDYDVGGLHQYLEEVKENFNSSGHHLGTTRMSPNFRSGVVDRDCRVHCVHNLYVAGGSVFPTSGHANPTLTILALSLRLADHLIERCSSAVAVTSTSTSRQGLC